LIGYSNTKPLKNQFSLYLLGLKIVIFLNISYNIER